MPNWEQTLKEINAESHDSPLDKVRGKYLKALSEYTGRNTIAYYSGWLTLDPSTPGVSISDNDVNFFMSVIHELDRTKGLDLILHTPGGGLAATESLVNYLRQMFGTNIRAIVPQLAMSAGTMIACACKEILMGKQSSLGPIDPQVAGGIPAYGVIQEFEQAIEEVRQDPDCLPIWQIIIGKYPPAFLGNCKKVISMAKEIVTEWLKTGMFADEKGHPVKTIVEYLSDLENTKTHARHIPVDVCEKIKLKILRIEEDQKLQDLILTVHHAFIHTINQARVVKIIENNNLRRIILRESK